MGLFGFGKKAQAQNANRATGGAQTQPRQSAPTLPEPTLPPPLVFTTREEAVQAMEEVGDLQRLYESGTMSNAQLASLGDEVTSRLQGVVAYFVGQGMEFNLYGQTVEPICAWAISHLAPEWIMDQGATPRTGAIKHSYFVITALMSEYERLKPS